jgi:hypothetical protein
VNNEWMKQNKLTRKKKKTLSSLMPSSAKSQLRGGKRNSGVIYDLDAWINYSEKLTNREKCEKKLIGGDFTSLMRVMWSER